MMGILAGRGPHPCPNMKKRDITRGHDGDTGGQRPAPVPEHEKKGHYKKLSGTKKSCRTPTCRAITFWDSRETSPNVT